MVLFFSIRSIDLAPDNIWHAQLKYANSQFQSIQERLRLQMDEQLTWLTLGNYLCALNRFNEAKSYYQYLINALPKDHKVLPSIYNNMGLVSAESGNDEQASKYYDIAEKLLTTISSNADNIVQSTPVNTLSQSSEAVVTIDCCTLYNKMAEVHLRQSEHKEALRYYRKALELATDPLARVQFEQKIKNILSHT